MKKIVVLAVLLCLGYLPSASAAAYFVVDGDSLEYGAERIRLQGIDAPEFLQKCADENGWKYRCGIEAKKYLEGLVVQGLTCRKLGTDRYQRSLKECFLPDGTSVNRLMVLNGWAVAYGDEYLAEERQAAALKKGIWKGKFMRPELYRGLVKKLKSTSKNKKR